jgi:hypothetical protein
VSTRDNLVYFHGWNAEVAEQPAPGSQIRGVLDTVLCLLVGGAVIGWAWPHLGPAALLLTEALLVSWALLRAPLLRVSVVLQGLGLASAGLLAAGWLTADVALTSIGLCLVCPFLIHSVLSIGWARTSRSAVSRLDASPLAALGGELLPPWQESSPEESRKRAVS